jgi:hypothetical protein
LGWLASGIQSPVLTWKVIRGIEDGLLKEEGAQLLSTAIELWNK